MLQYFIPTQKQFGSVVNHYEDDDFIDRLNNRWTVRILVICIGVIMGNMFWSKQIQCWIPNEFTGHHTDYAHTVCWLKGTYYLPTEEINIPDRSKPRTYFVSYYQWTPFILAGMAVLFLLPRFLWHACARQGGVNIRQIVKAIKDDSDPEKGVTIANQTLKLYLDAQYRSRGTVGYCYRCGRFYFGHTMAYFNTKFLYLINTISQFFLLNKFLSFHFTSYGFEALGKMYHGEDWFESPRFPRVTMCDFMVRRLGSNQHWYAVQCSLPLNLFHEKIFFGIWIWLILLTILNILSIFTWIYSLSYSHRSEAMKKYFKISGIASKDDELLMSLSNDIDQFLRYLEIDGYLIFRIIARNTDEIVAGKIIKYLHEHRPLSQGSDV